MIDLDERRGFLTTAFLFEGGLLVLALFIDYWFGFHALRLVTFDASGLFWGIAATLPLFFLYLVSLRYQPGPIARIHRLLDELFAPLLAACRWYDLILLALLAGVGEEMLFRGALQVDLLEEGLHDWLPEWGVPLPVAGWPALVIASLLFGVAHAVTPTYAVLAAFIGLYLGVLMDISGERSLTAPIITHALYDYLAFLIIVRRYRSHGEKTDVEESSGTSEAVEID